MTSNGQRVRGISSVGTAFQDSGNYSRTIEADLPGGNIGPRFLILDVDGWLDTLLGKAADDAVTEGFTACWVERSRSRYPAKTAARRRCSMSRWIRAARILGANATSCSAITPTKTSPCAIQPRQRDR